MVTTSFCWPDLNIRSSGKALIFIVDRPVWGLRKSFHQKMGNLAHAFIGYGVGWVISPPWAQFPHQSQKRTGLMEEAGSSVLASCGRSVIGHPWKIFVSLLLSSASHECLLLILPRLLCPWGWVIHSSGCSWRMNLPSHSSEGSLQGQ